MMGDREVYKCTHKLLGVQKDAEIDEMEWIRLKPLLAAEQALDLGRLDSGQLWERLGGLKKEDVCPGVSNHDAVFDASSMALFCSRFNPVLLSKTKDAANETE
jgi:hypothetical protein